MDSQLSMQKWCRDNRPKDNSLHKLKGMHGVKSDTSNRKGNRERQLDVKLNFYTLFFWQSVIRIV